MLCHFFFHILNASRTWPTILGLLNYYHIKGLLLINTYKYYVIRLIGASFSSYRGLIYSVGCWFVKSTITARKGWPRCRRATGNQLLSTFLYCPVRSNILNDGGAKDQHLICMLILPNLVWTSTTTLLTWFWVNCLFFRTQGHLYNL